MDQKFRSAGGRVSGITLIICGFVILPLAIGLVFSWPSKFSGAAFLFAPLSLWMIYAGFKTIKSTSRETMEAETKMKKINRLISVNEKEPFNHPSSTTDEPIILAHWKYPAKDWQYFMNMEKKGRRLSLWIEIILISLLGAFMIKYSRNESWKVGFAFSIPIGLIIGFVRYKFNISSILFSGQKDAEVIITKEAVIINNHYNRLSGDNLWLGNVAVKRINNLDVLEISYCWNTRGGNVSEEIRVPVPAGKMPEAITVKTMLLLKVNR